MQVNFELAVLIILKGHNISFQKLGNTKVTFITPRFTFKIFNFWNMHTEEACV